MKLKKGDKVLSCLTLAGCTTKEEEIVLKVSKSKNEVWLDNGAGNDPSGPFNLITGKHKDSFMSGRYIMKL